MGRLPVTVGPGAVGSLNSGLAEAEEEEDEQGEKDRDEASGRLR